MQDAMIILSGVIINYYDPNIPFKYYFHFSYCYAKKIDYNNQCFIMGLDI
jgi:hypothetical protein